MPAKSQKLKTDEVATIGYGGHDIAREDKFGRRITNIKNELAKMGFEIDFIYHCGGDEEPMEVDITAVNEKTGKKISFTVEEGKPKIDIKKLPQSPVKEGTCQCCGGDGWYVEPDEKGEPKQVQCDACRGQGGSKDPEPRIRPSGEPENEPFFENNLLGNMAKGMMGQPKGLAVNGKTVDESSVEIEDIDTRDYPDFCDAYVSSAAFEDGTELNDAELDEFNDKHGEWINEKIHNDQLWM
jgi:hypothetical protein